MDVCTWRYDYNPKKNVNSTYDKSTPENARNAREGVVKRACNDHVGVKACISQSDE